MSNRSYLYLQVICCEIIPQWFWKWSISATMVFLLSFEFPQWEISLSIQPNGLSPAIASSRFWAKHKSKAEKPFPLQLPDISRLMALLASRYIKPLYLVAGNWYLLHELISSSYEFIYTFGLLWISLFNHILCGECNSFLWLWIADFDCSSIMIFFFCPMKNKD